MNEKLVRDKIPDITAGQGKCFKFRTADKMEMNKLLNMKLAEEVQEYMIKNNVEELADILEVVFSIAKDLGYSEKELMAAREEKKKRNGGFDNRIVMCVD